MYGGFDHPLDRDGRLAARGNVARHPEPDGTPVLDILVGLMGDQARSPADRVVEGGTGYRRFVGREIRDDTVTMTLIYEAYEDGAQVDRIVQPTRTAVVDREAVHHRLDATGVEVVREFADCDRTPDVEGDGLLVVAAKPGSAPGD